MEDLYGAQPQMPQAATPQSSGGRKPKTWIAILLGVLLLAAIGFGVWQWLEVTKKNTEVSDLRASNTQLQSEVSNLQQQIGTGATVAQTDTEKILAATDAYTRAPVSAAGEVFKYSVAGSNDTFAKINVDVEGKESYQLVLKKTDNAWAVIISSQNSPTQADLDKYGVPTGFYEL
jgi:hypothetical protein